MGRDELVVAACTIALRFYETLGSVGGEWDWRAIMGEVSLRVAVSPAIVIELVSRLCVDREALCRETVRSGLVKYIFMHYIESTLDDKYNLYKAIKLLRTIAWSQRTLIHDKEHALALVVFTYEDYIPVIETICSKCYDIEHCLHVDGRSPYGQHSIDQPYLWSYHQNFCANNLSEGTIKSLIDSLASPMPASQEAKTYAILGNYCKNKGVILEQALKHIPKNPQSALNYIKMCVACCEQDQKSIGLINMPALSALVDQSTSPKAEQLLRYLKELGSRGSKEVGTLSDNVRNMFDMEKNADFMMERASKVPKNNQELTDIAQIMKQQDRANEFESDNLRTIK